MRVWRISNFADLSGKGGLIGSGRWHVRGTLVVYCADHPSTSVLEILVHANRQTVPDFYQLMEIDVPDALAIGELKLADGWQTDSAISRAAGTQIIRSNRFAVIRVPSVVMPKAANYLLNYLLNPLHEDAGKISIVATDRYPFDSRLLR